MFKDDFLLNGDTSKYLYCNVAKKAPIYDFHCHLSARDIYEDKVFTNISNIFLEFDHYKWRAMRYAGVPEKYITGDADALDKFKMWAKTCERLIGSPLYHWTNMELGSFFGIGEVLKDSNAEKTYNICNKKIKDENLSPIKFITNSNVHLVCTTDDPTDSLDYHKLLCAKVDLGFKVLPTFRPDKAIDISNKDFTYYLKKLSAVCSMEVSTCKDLLAALKERLSYFVETGCKLSDHSLESLVYINADEAEIEAIFSKRLSGDILSTNEAEKFKCFLIKKLAGEYHKRGVVMQFHIGAMRNNNEVMYRNLGPDAGFDIMNDFNIAPHLSRLFDEINIESRLPKTILYTLNPKDFAVLSAIPHCFCEDCVPGKLQFGAPWWFNDHKEGIYEHLKAIGNQGMLAYFIGMLTDSRSFLSYVRHDYFRRILCSFIGGLVDSGEFEKDYELLKKIIEGVCSKNIIKYLGLVDG